MLNSENKGFTVIELLVTISIIVVLSSIILFSITQYINTGKDASIKSNLAILVPAGEKYYDSNNESYNGFCNSQVKVNAFSEINSALPGAQKYCTINSNGNAWSACSQLTGSARAYCVDSRGIKKEIEMAGCISGITKCPD